ncbi:4598_t:CDS:2 [Entrophospora sp. SA101]|nr:18462_t:CDS:2 [Entrophospora sp. SA101]CAJ0758706.1 4598_t:CDS:2 [Entrophospora sp. SA101]
MSGFLSEMIKLPLFENTGNGTSLMCPGNNTTSSLKTYADFFSQVETFIPIAGLLFTIVIYVIECIYKHGEYEKVFAEIKVKNINEVVYFYKNDIKYRISSAKEYFYICEEDDDEGKNLEYKYDEEKQIEELKDKIFKKYFLKVKKYLFGQRVFECDPILKEIKKITKAKTKCSHFICEKLKKDMEKTTGTEIPGENRVKPKIKRIKVEWTGAEDKVRINILETGALNYFIYSHHKDSKDKCENKKENEENEQKEENEDICVDISEEGSCYIEIDLGTEMFDDDETIVTASEEEEEEDWRKNNDIHVNIASTSTSLTSAPSLSNLTLDSFYEVQSINLPKQKKAYNLRGGCKRKNAVWKYFNLKVKK